MYLKEVVCDSCDFTCGLSNPVTTCPDCGSPLTLRYDFNRIESISKNKLSGSGLPRYKKLLPVTDSLLSLGAGETPVIRSSYFGKDMPGDLYFKLEFANPTGSFKDRGTAVTVSKACEWGVEKVADDSSGNAGSSLAGYSARAGLDCTIYVPEKASGEKIVQVKSYGATLKTVPGPREKAMKKIREDITGTGTYYASHNLSPYFSEGMKTIAYEVSEEFNWEPPDHLVIPIGGGALLVGIYKGFKDLARLNWIEEIPRLHGVQTASCSPVVRAFNNSWNRTKPVSPKPTVAEGVHISNPKRGEEILQSIRSTNGRALEVTEEDIRLAHRQLAEREGLFAEPTSAVPLAGLERLEEEEIVDPGDEVLIPITGSGLKDVGSWKNS